MSSKFQTLCLGDGSKALLGFAAMLFSILPIAAAQPAAPSIADIEPWVVALGTRNEFAITAAERLGQFGAGAQVAIPALDQALRDEKHPQLQQAAAHALARIGPLAVPRLIEAASSSNSQLRRIASKALSLLEPSAEAVSVIRRELTNGDPAHRRAGAIVLGSLLSEEGVADTLQTTLKDPHPGVREAAALSFAADPARGQAALPALIDALRDDDPAVVRAAAATLARIAPTSKNAVGGLMTLSADGQSSRRRIGLRALAQIGPAAHISMPYIEAGLRSNDPSIRVVARQTLRQIDAILAQRMIGEPFDPVVASAQDRATLRVGPGDWPMWGGSRLRNNTPAGRNLPTAWNVETGQNIKWMARLGSQTYANPSVANGKIFIGTNNGHGYLKRYPSATDLGVMLCFEEATGRFLWQYSSEKLPTGRVHDWPMQGMPSTPVVDGHRLWAVTNRCEVVCLDTEGFRDGENDGPFVDEPNHNADEADVVWRFDMMKQLGVSPHNMSNCSPLLVDSRLFVCTSNGVDDGHTKLPAPQAASFVALDRDTGNVLWTDNSPGENILHAQWASPSYAVLGGQPQVIFGGGDGWLYSFDPQGNGRGGSKLLWKFDCNAKDAKYFMNGRSTRNHLIGFVSIYDDLLYLAIGEDPEHGEGPGRLWCIDPTHRLDGSDVSGELVVDATGKLVPPRRLCAVEPPRGERVLDNPSSAVVWQYTQEDRDLNGKFEFEEEFHRTLGTPAIKDDLLYMIDFSGLFHCFDAKTGELRWNYDLLAASWGSPLIVDGKVYVGDEDGKVTIFRHSGEPEIALPNGEPLTQIEMSDSIYATPVVANGVLYIATKNALFAIQSQDKSNGGSTQ